MPFLHLPSDVLSGCTCSRQETSVVLSAGQRDAQTSVDISSSAFLTTGAAFELQLVNVTVSPGIHVSLGCLSQMFSSALSLTEFRDSAYNSPRLGTRNHVNISVTAAAANGEIGFANATVVVATEPEFGANRVDLLLTREGTNGRATVFWNMVASSQNNSNNDATPSRGSVTMPTG